MLEELFKQIKEYIVLRNYSYLPYSTGGSDLDITIPENKFRETEDLLFKIAAECKGTLVSFIPSKSCPKYCFQGENWGIQIDLFLGGITYVEKIILPYSDLEKHKKYHNDIKVLDNSYAEIISFLKEILNNLTCSQKYFNSFINNRSKTILDELFKPIFSDKLIDNFLNLKSYRKDDIYNLGINSRKELGINSININKNKIANLVKRLQTKPGYTIAFLGTDGSGKSTIINAITPLLNEAFHNGVFYEHMRPNKLPSIAKLMGKEENFTGRVDNPHALKQSGFIGSLIRFLYYYIDYTLGYYLKIFPKKAFKSCVWVFDRYYYDYLVDQKRARIKLPKMIIEIGAFFLPKPDMIICLGTDADKIYARKPEIAFEEVQRQVKALKAFSEQHKRAVWIDTGVDIAITQNECLKYITNFMTNRFKHVNK